MSERSVEKTKNDENKIYVCINKDNTAKLTFPKYGIKTVAYIGKNGATYNKAEGDGCTPIGEFELGLILGTHSKLEFCDKLNLKYTQITDDMYWIDDINSKYYNTLVIGSDVQKDWNSAEHLIDYPVQYEYCIEIKSNPCNIPGKGSAIFIHCINNTATLGCVAVDRTIMKEIIKLVDCDTIINIFSA